MAKDTFYFPHDYNPRSDDKIKPLIRKYGMTGYGAFWAIVEDLYNNANALRTDYEGIAFELRVEELMIKSIINDFDLFVIDGDYFGSISVERRLEERNKKSLKAKESAFKRWGKKNESMPTQCERIDFECECNAIKEKKEKKEINIPPPLIPKKEKNEEEKFEFKDGIKRNTKSIIQYMDNYSILGMDRQTILEYTNYGEIGGYGTKIFMKLINDIRDSKGKILMPDQFIMKRIMKDLVAEIEIGKK
ncbi:MAG: DUF4373 domain-containing protein [Paludibacteraceae bacterium]|nr:DUF4373 domain-containing protein [Paludibacteraceae bacterium]